MKLVNQQLIKDTNLKHLYNCILKDRGISRATLAKKTNLSKTTVSSLIDELIEREFIYDSGISEEFSAVGRKPNSLQICSEKHYVIVINLEEQNLHIHLVDVCGINTSEWQCEITCHDDYLPQSIAYVRQQLLPKYSNDQILGICVIIPAMLDPDKREVFAAGLHLPHDLLNQYENAFSDFSIAFLNDTACFAYAEKVFAHVSEADFAFINYNHRIGATLFIQGSMLGKATAAYTQFGHYSVDPKGLECSCGNRGCLELLVGETSLRDRIREAGGKSALSKLSYITYADLGRAAQYGDQTAHKVICALAQDFAIALSNLICLVHPVLVIIGGRGKSLGSLFIDEINFSLKHIGFRRMVDSVNVCYSQLDTDACYSGAMQYFFDIHFQFAKNNNHTIYIG